MSNFDRCLKPAEKYELWFADMYFGKGRYTTNPNKNNEYDIQFNYDGSKYEVKTELMASCYLRTAIELTSREKDSGLNTSKSDFYVFIYPILNRTLIIPTDVLKRFVEDNRKYGSTRMGGDDNRQTLVLFNIDFFITELSEIEGVKVIKDRVPMLYPKSAVNHLLSKFEKYSDTREYRVRYRNNPGLKKTWDIIKQKFETWVK